MNVHPDVFILEPGVSVELQYDGPSPSKVHGVITLSDWYIVKAGWRLRGMLGVIAALVLVARRRRVEP